MTNPFSLLSSGDGSDNHSQPEHAPTRPTFSGQNSTGVTWRSFLLMFQAFLVSRRVVRPVRTETRFGEGEAGDVKFNEATAAFNRDRLSWLVQCLLGDALLTFQLLSPEEQEDFDVVIDHLRRTFDDHLHEKFRNFISLRQQSGESLEAFGARLRLYATDMMSAISSSAVLSTKASGGGNMPQTSSPDTQQSRVSPNPLLEFFLVQLFVAGLEVPQNVRQFAMEHAADPAMRLSVLIPLVKKMLLSSRAEAASSGLACGGFAHQHHKGKGSHPSSTSSSSASSSSSSSRGRRVLDRSQVTCHRCREKGHFASECTAPAPKPKEDKDPKDPKGGSKGLQK